MRIEEVATTGDTSVLWRALVAAKDAGDARLVRAIEQRMRDLADERRFAHLSDEELRRQIGGMSGNREPTGMLGHSPVNGGWEGGVSAAATSSFNEAHRRQQHVGVEVTLAALLAEWRRRHPDDPTPR